jgi:DNA-directed RNA polymerase II subunit RPB2
METNQLTAVQLRQLAEEMIHSYFTTQEIPLTKHHIDSYDQFLDRDMLNIIKSNNPLLILKDKLPDGDSYKYRVEIFVGGLDGNDIQIGAPTIMLDKGEQIRLMYPNEARLRNLTYGLSIEATLHVRVTLRLNPAEDPQVHDIKFEQFPLFKLPLMLKSRYCILHNKPNTFLEEAGECPQDYGGYFIVEGSEKVLITRQEGAFNTLYVSEQPRDDKISHYATLTSLNAKTRVIKRVAFYYTRERTRSSFKKTSEFLPSVLEISIPFVKKPLNIFVLFRALGIQSDKDIMQLIFPDLDSPEARNLSEMLIPSITAAYPFVDTYSAVHYIKTLTKGFSEFHVLNIIHTMLFPHVEDRPMARVSFLAACVRQILRVVKGIDQPTNKDDTRNQRLLSSGFLVQMLFQGVYGKWMKAVQLKIGEEYNYNKGLYGGENFLNIFSPGNARVVFQSDLITQGLTRGFKGKWIVGSGKSGEEKSGIIQSLSRESYLDFLSHCRRVVLDFDTSMKLAGPRRLSPSQYGFFCTVETPSGATIGITKNLAIFTSVSTSADTDGIIRWLFTKGMVLPCGDVTPQLASVMVPVYLNNGILGYTANPQQLNKVLRLLKRTACIPPYCSVGFNIPQRRVFLFFDEGRPLRPLWVLPLHTSKILKNWTLNVIGSFPDTKDVALTSTKFYDPLEAKEDASFNDYIELLTPYTCNIEYVDPYEQNEILITNFPEQIVPETTHIEIHPTSILGVLANMIPFCNHNQSPRNHLSSSQSKQSLSMYATNWKNRFDNSANVLCYGEAPLSRTIYQDYIGSGKMTYGHNIVLAMGIYTGYNQEDGIVMNEDALERGLYRSIKYRTYEAFEEDDEMTKSRSRVGNPTQVHAWMDIDPALDYSKLDDSGLVRVGEYVTETTVIIGRYLQVQGGKIKDSSVTPQVWTRGRVESVIVTVNNVGLRLIKIRVVQDRKPELGDKFSNRHGQKGTIGMMFRGHDMPRTEDGIVPDMIMNPHAIPSRMTIAQLHEQLFGKAAALLGSIANATAWMNEGSPHETIGKYLEDLGFEKTGNQILYNGQTGAQIEADIFIGNVYSMRLRHMTEDKWNARGEGRREQRTHQPTGGRGNQGGLKIGEMERDAIIGHGVANFLQESMMLRSDGSSFYVCNSCGTFPIYNEKEGLYICTLCDGPIHFIGDTVNTMDPVPSSFRSATSFSKIEMPYSTKLFIQEMEFFMNMGSRTLTTYETNKLHGLRDIEGRVSDETEDINMPLPTRVFQEFSIPEMREVSTNIPIEDALRGLQDVQKQTTGLIEELKINTVKNDLPEVQLNLEPQVQAQTQVQAQAQAQTPEKEQPSSKIPIVEKEEKPEDTAPVIVVDTSQPAMIAEGLEETPKLGPGRPPKINKPASTKPKFVLESDEEQSGGSAQKSLVADPNEETHTSYKEVITVQKME